MFVSTREAAEILGISLKALRLWRQRGTGPAYHKMPTGTFRYRASDLAAWMGTRVELTQQQHTPGPQAA